MISILVVIMVKSNNAEGDVVEFLRKANGGLTITELVNLSKFSRSTVRVVLARLEGGEKVNVRVVGMAKIYSLI